MTDGRREMCGCVGLWGCGCAGVWVCGCAIEVWRMELGRRKASGRVYVDVSMAKVSMRVGGLRWRG